MIFIMYFANRISLIIVLVFLLAIQTTVQFFDGNNAELDNRTSPTLNQSLNTTEISTTPSLSSSSILKALFTEHRSLNEINNSRNSFFLNNQSTSLLSSLTSTTSQNIPMTTVPISPYMLANFLVNQFNHHRNIDILSRIQQCDLKLKLNDMCETYSFDNHTYSLIRDSYVEFQSLEHVYRALIDRVTVERLMMTCQPGHWCSENLTQDDIHFVQNVLRQRGRSFCSLEGCHRRLTAYTTTCPSVSSKNISTPTLKLLPMLCTLYKEQQSWNSTGCIEQIAYLLHILYAFWSEIETCHYMITAGSGGCTSECLSFDTILHNVENQCGKNASFLTRVPTLAWYRLVDLKQICRHDRSLINSPFVSSVKDFISSQLLWYRYHQRPVYVVVFVILIICIVSGFSLCLYIMSKGDYESSDRRFDDDYEYTRLHDSTFELGSDTNNTNLSSTRLTNESTFDYNRIPRSPENQRLL